MSTTVKTWLVRSMFVFVWTVMLSVSTQLFAADTPSDKQGVSAQENLRSDFAKMSDNKKLDSLKELLVSGKDSSFDDFYYLLSKAEKPEIGIFKDAMESKGDLKALMYMGRYVQNTVRSLLELYSVVNPNASASEMKMAIIERNESLGKKFILLEPEFKLIAGKNTKVLVNTILTAYSKIDENTSKEEINRSGINEAAMALLLLGDDGFDALLNSITSKSEQTLLITLMEVFGPAAVVPVLKAYEDPKSSKVKRDAAGTLIYFFSKTDSAVIDKVVEAYKHGRYFEIQTKGKVNEKGEKVMDLEALFGAVNTWWGVHLEANYKGERAVAKYIGEKYLSKGDFDTSVVRLVCAIDFKTGMSYLSDLNPNNLSEKTLQEVFSICSASSDKTKADEYIDEKFAVYSKLFLKSTYAQRKQVIYGLMAFPLESVAEFIIKNFETFSNDEKTTVIFLSGDSVTREIPPSVRKKIFDGIKSSCNQEQLKTMEFVLEKKSK